MAKNYMVEMYGMVKEMKPILKNLNRDWTGNGSGNGGYRRMIDKLIVTVDKMQERCKITHKDVDDRINRKNIEALARIEGGKVKPGNGFKKVNQWVDNFDLFLKNIRKHIFSIMQSLIIIALIFYTFIKGCSPSAEHGVSPMGDSIRNALEILSKLGGGG
jgi:hypothetical protein